MFRRHTDGIVLHLASREQTDLMLDILLGNFTAHKPVITSDFNHIAEDVSVEEGLGDVDSLLSGVDLASLSFEDMQAAVRGKTGAQPEGKSTVGSSSKPQGDLKQHQREYKRE